MIPVSGLRRHGVLLLGCALLVVLYTLNYFGQTARPGANAAYPAGWWGWWDQSNYLKSAQALARLNFDPDQHLYPLGYALLGAAFVGWLPQHPFFLVDLAALLVTVAAFASLTRRCGIPPAWSVPIFVLAAAADPVLLQQWAVPWSTTPVAAVLWLLLAVAAAHVDGHRRPGWLGLLAVCIPMLRPTDLALALPPLAICLLADLRHRRLAWRDVLVFAAAVLIPAAAYLGLHAAIYGLQPSAYMRGSSAIGFSLHRFDWKAYLILVDPQPWIGGGEGLLRRCPWLLLGLAGLVPALMRPKSAMLAITLLLHSLIYLAYVDLLPTGFWRYLNLHYWTWAFPGFALLGLLLLRDLAALPGRRGMPVRLQHRLAAGLGIALAAVVPCLRYDPVPAQPGQIADAVDFAVAPPGFQEIYFGRLEITDAAGTLGNITHVRAIPLGASIRFLALTRGLRAPIRAEGEAAKALNMDIVTPTALRARLTFASPFRRWPPGGALYGPQ